MTARLISFEYEPRGSSGWTSTKLRFGGVLTAVGGPNGSGKTPIMKGIMAALGHEVELPPEVVERCSAACLQMEIRGESVELRRALGEEFYLESRVNQESRIFTSEGDFADWFLECLGVHPRLLTNRRHEAVRPYLNVYYPLFWVDQDVGWTSIYVTPPDRDFILSQYQEMVRLALGLPPRHPFRSRDDYEKAKRDLSRIEKAIDAQRYLVLRLRSEIGNESKSETDLRRRREELKAELAANEHALEAIRAVTQRFDAEIVQLEERRRELQRRAAAYRGRRQQLELALQQIDGEAEILAANVQAADFLRWICSSENCGLFHRSEESYGRMLLFLRDQIKDLRSSDSSLSEQISNTELQIQEVEHELAIKRKERDAAASASPHAQIYTQVEAITQEIVAIELRLSRLEQLAAEERKFERALDRREEISQLVQHFRPKGTREDKAAIFDAVQLLSRLFEEWLRTLGTPNLPSDMRVTEEFEVDFGGNKFTLKSSPSGSTRTRIVLAFHAALLEAALIRRGNHPGWLILDAPRQHELRWNDLDAYLSRLHDVARRFPSQVQVVFSIANVALKLGEEDAFWSPAFGEGEDARYLGSLSG